MCLAKNGVEEEGEEIYALIKLQVQCKHLLPIVFGNDSVFAFKYQRKMSPAYPGYVKKLDDFC